MKKLSIIAFLVGLFSLGATFTSCEDMLTPNMDRNAETFSGRDSVYFYLGILGNVQDMIEQNVITSDVRSDLVATTLYTSDSISNLANFETGQMDGDNALLNRAAYYKVINQCNYYLAAVDTMAIKNNIYYMRREFAQVVDIRAWVYLQLVQNYGRVPFITKPVDNADTGWETNPEQWATADNLLDLLQDDLQQALQYEHRLGYPQYGTFNTGAGSVTFNYSKFCFHADLILGDLYLLRGASREDFMKAAQYYYYYITEKGLNTNSSAAGVAKREKDGRTSYSYEPGNYIKNYDTENITILPSAANSTFGRVLTRIPQIYGFTPSSTNSTSSSAEGDDVATSGEISVTPDVRARQIGPSAYYEQLSLAQNYVSSERDKTTDAVSKVEYFEGMGDARFEATVPKIRTDKMEERFVCKYTPYNHYREGRAENVNFRYSLALYRTPRVYLRLAEAINRAGYPRHAWAILRKGIQENAMPILSDSLAYNADSTQAQVVYYVNEVACQDQASFIDCLTADELRRAYEEPAYNQWLNFKDSRFTLNKGIHELGCGNMVNADSLYSYDLAIAARIEQEAARSGAEAVAARAYAKKLRQQARDDENEEGEGEEGEGEKEPVEPEIIPAPDVVYDYEALKFEINAVETYIADELALQCAFEGERFFDLMRFARHKNAAGLGSATYGNEWLAWLISRRDLNLAPYEEPQTTGSLYGRLLEPENWWLPSPKY